MLMLFAAGDGLSRESAFLMKMRINKKYNGVVLRALLNFVYTPVYHFQQWNKGA